MIAVLLIWILVSIFPKKVFWLGIGTAIILSLADFYFKYTNDRPWDMEGFAVMNLGLLAAYILMLIFFFITIASICNFKKAFLFIPFYAGIAALDFYFLGTYSALL
ncbi:MAG: hypothetical protein KAG64_00940 [Bacteroidales bacterium]|nr:hypothetical protein [Bacteroidales bacterium]